MKNDPRYLPRRPDDPGYFRRRRPLTEVEYLRACAVHAATLTAATVATPFPPRALQPADFARLLSVEAAAADGLEGLARLVEQ